MTHTAGSELGNERHLLGSRETVTYREERQKLEQLPLSAAASILWWPSRRSTEVMVAHRTHAVGVPPTTLFGLVWRQEGCGKEEAAARGLRGDRPPIYRRVCIPSAKLAK